MSKKGVGQGVGGGQPLKFQTSEELEAKIQDYFDSCYDEVGEWVKGEWVPELDSKGKPKTQWIRPLTVSGLAVHLDTTRETLMRYEKDYDEKAEGEGLKFSDTIIRAKQVIFNFTEESLHTNRNTSGIVFSLINNYGWTQRQEVDHKGSVPITVDGAVKDWSK